MATATSYAFFLPYPTLSIPMANVIILSHIHCAPWGITATELTRRRQAHQRLNTLPKGWGHRALQRFVFARFSLLDYHARLRSLKQRGLVRLRHAAQGEREPRYVLTRKGRRFFRRLDRLFFCFPARRDG